MEQHDYIVLLEKFFKKEASSEERRILIEWIRKPGIRDEFNSLCEQMWKEAAVEIDKTVEEEMLYIRWRLLYYYRFVWGWPLISE